jgi:hypothetical protein
MCWSFFVAFTLLLPSCIWGVQTQNSTRAQSAGLDAADNALEFSGTSNIDRPHHRGRSLKCVGLVVKRRISVWESNEEGDALDAEVVTKGGLPDALVGAMKGGDPSLEPSTSTSRQLTHPDEEVLC